MKICNKRFDCTCLFMLIILPLYQDSPLSSILGAGGYTLLIPFIYFLFFFKAFSEKKLFIEKNIKELFMLGIMLFIVSFAAIGIWALFGNSINVLGEFLPWKAIKSCIQYFSYPMYIYLIFAYVKKIGLDIFCKFIFVGLVTMSIVCLVEINQIPNAFESFHSAGVYPYWRVRLLTLEASTTMMMIFVYSAISIYYWLNKKERINLAISFILFLFLLLSSGSKSLLISFLATFLVYVMIVSKKKIGKKKVLLITFSMVLCLLLFFVLIPKLINGLNSDIENYTSVATRLYTSFIGLFIGIVFPFGVGGAVYLGVLQKFMIDFFSIMQNFSLNLSEIISLMTQTDGVALTVKSGILHYNVYWGIVGTFFLFRNFARISRKIKDNEFLRSCFIVSVLLLFSVNFSYEFWLLYTFILCKGPEHRFDK